MASTDSLSLRTASRLHFGLFGGQSGDGVSYGGIGAMVAQPGLHLSIEPNDQSMYRGQQADRLQQFAKLWHKFTGLDADAGYSLELVASPESHVGLGTGTQLGLAVSALLFQFYYDEVPNIETIAKSVSRGARSAVGTYGFLHGGFIVDRGKTSETQLAPLGLHMPIPEDWRFVLIRSSTSTGLSGKQESRVFSKPGKDLQRNHDLLVRMTNDRILPALLNEAFDEFSEAIYEFGKTSGSYFEHIQGGPFNGERIMAIVEHARSNSVAGVGQSSWGPTVFLLAKSPESANRIATQMSPFLLSDESLLISPPMNRGYQISSVERATP